jgi:hypothetical protein
VTLTELGSPLDNRFASGLLERPLVISLSVDRNDCVTDYLFEARLAARSLKSPVWKSKAATFVSPLFGSLLTMLPVRH